MTKHCTIRIVTLVLGLLGAECAISTLALAETAAATNCNGWLHRVWWKPENNRTPADVVHCAGNHQGQDLAHPLREVVSDRFPEDTGASATRALLAAGADPNHRDRFKWTPLTYWALNGRGGYDPDQRNRTEAADEAQVRALLEAGADPNTPRRANFRSNPASLIPHFPPGFSTCARGDGCPRRPDTHSEAWGSLRTKDGGRCTWPRLSELRSARSGLCSNTVPTPT